MKKLLALALTLVMAATLFTACGSDKKEEKASQAKKQIETVKTDGVKLLKKGTLSVGVEIGYPPFEQFADDGKTPEGYDIDVIEEVGARLGLKVNYVNTAFDGIFKGIDKNYDVVCSAITINAERKKTMLFSEPYIDNYQAVVTLKNNKKKISKFNDLDGMTIGLQQGTTSEELIGDLKNTGTIKTNMIASEKVTTCFTQLENGEVDAVVVDSTVADGQVAKNKKLQIAWKDTKEAEQFGIAMGKGNKPLQKAISAAIVAMKKDGTLDDSYDFWFKGTK